MRYAFYNFARKQSEVSADADKSPPAKAKKILEWSPGPCWEPSHSSQERQFSFSFRNNQARLSPHNTRWWQQTAANSRELYLAGGSRLTGNGSLLFFGRMGRGGLGFRIQISWLLFVRNKSARLWACAGCLGSFREASASSMESKQHVSQQKNHIWRAGSGQVKQSSMIYVDSKFQYEWQVGLARVQGAMPSFGLVLPEH